MDIHKHIGLESTCVHTLWRKFENMKPWWWHMWETFFPLSNKAFAPYSHFYVCIISYLYTAFTAPRITSMFMRGRMKAASWGLDSAQRIQVTSPLCPAQGVCLSASILTAPTTCKDFMLHSRFQVRKVWMFLCPQHVGVIYVLWGCAKWSRIEAMWAFLKCILAQVKIDVRMSLWGLTNKHLLWFPKMACGGGAWMRGRSLSIGGLIEGMADIKCTLFNVRPLKGMLSIDISLGTSHNNGGRGVRDIHPLINQILAVKMLELTKHSWSIKLSLQCKITHEKGVPGLGLGLKIFILARARARARVENIYILARVVGISCLKQPGHLAHGDLMLYYCGFLVHRLIHTWD